ncbi:DUF6083 domain-containing protein [Streptomyces flavidovirens]
MRLHATSASKSLRRDSVTRCRYCWHSLDWYDRFGGGRIPLIPRREFPCASVPMRCRWHVSNGIAYPGDGGQSFCRIAHPTMCPGVEHADADDPDLKAARLAHRMKTREWLDARLFVPDMRVPEAEADIAEQLVSVKTGSTRHVMRYFSRLWLGPATISEIRCVARSRLSGRRCKNVILEDELCEGDWQQIEVPVGPGRARSETLWGGQLMWVYELHVLESSKIKRWIDQRCVHHGQGSTAPNAEPAAWVPFDVFRHSEYILYEPPPEATARPAASRSADDSPKRTVCAAPGCWYGSVAPVAEGWLCYRCRPKHERRERTRRWWQTPEEP